MPAPETIRQLVQRFDQHRETYVQGGKDITRENSLEDGRASGENAGII
jgi:hypothetical protein